jgi:hypothetical protein
MITQKLGFFCCLVPLLLAGACGLVGCSDQPGTLEGIVTWSPDGTPLLGAEVRIFALDRVEGTSSDMPVFAKGRMLQEQRTGEDGTFSFLLEPGDYVVGVWVKDEEVASARVEVKGRRTATLDLSADIDSP